MQVCARLGVSALRQRMWAESSDFMELSEAAGQSEALTTRLRHITGTPEQFLPDLYNTQAITLP